MGTYSNYRLEILDKNRNILIGDIKEQLIETLMGEYQEANYALTVDGQTAQEAKWYTATEDLSKFSQQKPDYFFVLIQSLCTPDNPDLEGTFFIEIINGKTRLLDDSEGLRLIKDIKYAYNDSANSPVDSSYVILAYYNHQISNAPWFIGNGGYNNFTTQLKAAKTFDTKAAATRFFSKLRKEDFPQGKYVQVEQSRVVMRQWNEEKSVYYFSEV